MSKTIRKVFNKYKTSSTEGLAIYESNLEVKFDKKWLKICHTFGNYILKGKNEKNYFPP